MKIYKSRLINSDITSIEHKLLDFMKTDKS